jgi:hemerythrin superfamily protein
VTSKNTDLDVVDGLMTDHREKLELLHRIASITDPDERRDLADTVISEVVRHAIAEEMYVYPALREHVPDGEQAVKHDNQEHQQLEEIMKRLEAVQPADPRFDALVGEMTDQLRRHAHDEETEQFPLLRE